LIGGLAVSQAWLATGDETNWHLGVDQGIWGVVPKLERAWTRLAAGDLLFFYVAAPVGRVVGFGTIRTKFRQDRPLWPPEIEADKVIWPYRFEFDRQVCLHPREWRRRGISPEGPAGRLPLLAGLNPIGKPGNVEWLVRELELAHLAPPADRVAEAQREEWRREWLDVQKKLVAIGTAQRFFADPDFAVDKSRLDVAWRRLLNSVPTYAFQVPRSSDLDTGLRTLKFAHQMWNSRVFVVSKPEITHDLNDLVNSSFPELRGVIRTLTIEEVNELHGLKSRLQKFEQRLGLA
jgi:hypothetical protein